MLKYKKGFTLVEVLVALAVLAIALTATMRSMGQAIDVTTRLRDRSVAMWIAQDRAAMLQVRRLWPAIDTTEGTTEMAGREWRWREQVSATPVADMRRVDIEILDLKQPDVLARLPAFVQKP